MERYYIVKDGKIEASAATRENAISLVRSYQAVEKRTHKFLWSEFSIIKGTEEIISYE